LNELAVPRHELSSADGPASSLSQPVRRSGIPRQVICVIRLLDSTVLGVSWSHSCLHIVSSAIIVSSTMKNLTIYLL